MNIFVIVPLTEVSNAMINVSNTTSIETLRISNDEQLTVLGFDENNELAQAVFVDYIWYPHHEMCCILDEDDNWKGQNL